MESYKLYLDRPEDFECDIQLEGMSERDASPRLVVDTPDVQFVYEGMISNGKCTIPLKKLKSLLKEGCSGDLRLEIISENTILVPWEGRYDAILDKKAQVEVCEKKFTSAKKQATVSFTQPSVPVVVETKKEEPEPVIVETKKEEPVMADSVSNFISKLKQKKTTPQQTSTFDTILNGLK